MAMTGTMLFIIAAMGVLLAVGSGYRSIDPWFRVAMAYGSSVTWGVFAVSSMDVIVTTGVDPPVSEPMWPAVFLGLTAALAVFGWALYGTASTLASDGAGLDLEDVYGAR